MTDVKACTIAVGNVSLRWAMETGRMGLTSDFHIASKVRKSLISLKFCFFICQMGLILFTLQGSNNDLIG